MPQAAQDDWATSSEGEDFAFDGGEYSKEDLGGEGVKREGRYHFEVIDVEANLSTVNDKGKPQSPHIVFVCSVLASDKGCSPVGAKLFHKIYFASVDDKGNVTPPKEGSIKAALRFGEGIGVLKEVEKDGKNVFVDVATGNTKITPKAYLAAKHKQFCCEIKQEEGQVVNGRKYDGKFAIPFGRVYSPADEYCSDWPKDAEALKVIGVTATKGGASGQGGKKAETPPAANNPTTPPPADDEIDDDL